MAAEQKAKRRRGLGLDEADLAFPELQEDVGGTANFPNLQLDQGDDDGVDDGAGPETMCALPKEGPVADAAADVERFDRFLQGRLDELKLTAPLNSPAEREALQVAVEQSLLGRQPGETLADFKARSLKLVHPPPVPVQTPWPFGNLEWKEIQSSPLARGLYRDHVVNVLSNLVAPNACVEDLKQHLTFGAVLGEGSYGSVSQVQLTSPPPGLPRFPMALKTTKFTNRVAVVHSLREITAMTRVGALVDLNVCPNYSLVYTAWLCKMPAQDEYELNVLMELADNTVSGLLRHNLADLTQDTIMGFLFQALVGVTLAYGTLDIAHNDLKRDNLLVTTTSVGHVEYRLLDKVYCLRNSYVLVKLTDWGLATGQGTGHRRVPMKNYDPDVDFYEPEQQVHVTKYNDRRLFQAGAPIHAFQIRHQGENLRPFDHNILFVLTTFGTAIDPVSSTNECLRHHSKVPVRWLRYAAQTLQQMREDDKRHLSYQLAYINHIFSPPILTRFGLNPELLAPWGADEAKYPKSVVRLTPQVVVPVPTTQPIHEALLTEASRRMVSVEWPERSTSGVADLPT